MGNWFGFRVRQRAEAPAPDLSQLEAPEVRAPSPAPGPLDPEKFGARLAPVLQHYGITKDDAEMIRQLVREHAIELFNHDHSRTGTLVVAFATGLATACAALNHLARNDGRAPGAEVRDAA